VTVSGNPGWHELIGMVGDALYRAALAEGVRLHSPIGSLMWQPGHQKRSAGQFLREADRALRRYERALDGADGKTTRPKAARYAEWAEGIATRSGSPLAAAIGERLKGVAGDVRPSAVGAGVPA
jgi:hypothetical protein